MDARHHHEQTGGVCCFSQEDRDWGSALSLRAGIKWAERGSSGPRERGPTASKLKASPRPDRLISRASARAGKHVARVIYLDSRARI